MRGIFGFVTDFSAHLRRFWCGFLPAPGVSRTVSEPSVEVDDGGVGGRKHALLALPRWTSDMARVVTFRENSNVGNFKKPKKSQKSKF